MVNENEVVNVLKQGSLVKYQVVDLGTMSFKEQLQVRTQTLPRHAGCRFSEASRMSLGLTSMLLLPVPGCVVAVQVMRQANIYIGIHGAGLMHAYFLAEEVSPPAHISTPHHEPLVLSLS